jgi:hypothetical protein
VPTISMISKNVINLILFLIGLILNNGAKLSFAFELSKRNQEKIGKMINISIVLLCWENQLI